MRAQAPSKQAPPCVLYHVGFYASHTSREREWLGETVLTSRQRSALFAPFRNARPPELQHVRIGDLQTTVNDRIGDLQTTVNDRIGDLQMTVNDRIGDLRSDVGELRTDVRGFDARLREVEVGFGKIDQRLTGLGAWGLGSNGTESTVEDSI